MRIVSWNLAHQTAERPIKPAFEVAVAALSPDILVLNEFVDGPTRTAMKDRLAALGLCAQLASPRVGKNNQIFVASRQPITPASIRGPTTTDAALSNFCHVETFGLSLIALRVPAYSGAERSSYWRDLSGILSSAVTPRAIAIGDFNADPSNLRSFAGRALRGLESSGWRLANPIGEWSYCSSRARTRIDHGLLGPQLVVESAAYMPAPDGRPCAGSDSSLYDHAPLVIDFREAAS